MSLCVALNLRYAARWGYHFLWFQAEGMQLRFRRRHAAWSRVLAVTHAMNLGYARVAYLDTDAIFNDHSLSLGSFLAQSLRDTPQTAALPSLAAPHVASVITFWNDPYHRRKSRPRPSHTGVMFFQSGTAALAILSRWWFSTRFPRYDALRDWDQGTWNEAIVSDATLKEHIAVLEETCMRWQEHPARQFVLHFAGKRVPKKGKAVPWLTRRFHRALTETTGARAGEAPTLDTASLVNASAACLLGNGTAGAACALAGLGSMRGFAFSLDTSLLAKRWLEPLASAKATTLALRREIADGANRGSDIRLRWD